MEKKMVSKLNQKTLNILILLLVSALSVSLWGCADKKPRVKRADASGDETVVEEQSKDVVVVQSNSGTSTAGVPSQKPTQKTTAAQSSNPFEGSWDVDLNGTFANWSFGYASKNGEKLEGKITDNSGSVIGDYTVLPNKTVELNIYSAGVNAIVGYKVSNGGNQIQIDDGSNKVSLTKGKTNSTIQNDGSVLASKGWSNITNSSDIIKFTSLNQSSAGWTGSYARGSDYGTFKMTAGKITLNSQSNGSVNSYSYKIRGNSVLDLTDSKGNTESFN